ncbi:ROK family transcriptional regulator [Alicyclobacillus herbarius]|uniref:ROK family transcriptional regulator n=1 Tax=Alicyclobacillus herbarius TaxID=122960 RepID=UPI000411E7B3|nr:ROK family transcriptional regulator [Alicyclobacillus herbarius]
MKRTGDQAFIKELNKSIVLNLLRFQSPISRTQISVQTGLNKATVSSIVEELIQEDLVLEVGRGHTRVGRRPVLLLFNARAGYVIGVDLGVDYVRVLATDLAGEIAGAREFRLTDNRTPQHVVESIVRGVHELKAELPRSPHGIIGVGVGVPGLVDFSHGIVLNAPNLAWRDVHLGALLENYLSLPVYVDNEANTGALGEKLFGVGKEASNLIYISVGTGIGTGIIVNNELVRGSQGIAGEFGHMTIEAQGLKCSCGNHGCLEMYASERALVQKYRHLTGLTLPTEDILARLKTGDADALQAIQTVGQYLGIGVANLAGGLNPSLILVGNRLASAGEWLLRPIEQTVQNRCFTMPYTQLRIQASSLGRNACAVGAASLVLHEYFAGPQAAA